MESRGLWGRALLPCEDVRNWEFTPPAAWEGV